MNALESLRHADPGKQLTHRTLDARDEQLLHQILRTAGTEPDAPAKPPQPASARTVRDWKPKFATIVVAIAVLAATIIAIRAVPSRDPHPAAPTSPTATAADTLEAAVFAELSTVATGDLAVQDKSALTWTQARATATGEGIDLTGKTLYIAAACEGGGSIAIQISGRPDVNLQCDRRATTGPINLTTTRNTERQATNLNVTITSGHPRYIAKAMAFPTPTPSR